MMRRIFKIFFLLPLVLLWSCKEEELPVPTEGDPVFYANLSVDGQLHNIEAGNDFYFNGTSFDFPIPDLAEMSGGLNVFIPNSAQEPEFTVRIRNFELNQSVDPSLSLQPGTYDLLRPAGEDSVSVVHFFANSPQPTTQFEYSWNFGDGSTSTERNPIHIYSDPDIGKYNVCLTISNDSCSNTLCSDVFLPNARCTAGLAIAQLSPLEYVFTALHSGFDPVKYDWSFGSVNSNAQSAIVDYNYVSTPLSGFDEVCVKITDATGCEATYCENVLIDPIADCAANFSYFVRDTTMPGNNSSFSKVVIEYSENGQFYSSNHSSQPTSSTFEIIEIEPYKKNREGLNTSAVRMRSKCTVYSISSNDSLQLEIQDARLAIGHP